MVVSPDYGHIKLSRKAFRPRSEGGSKYWNEPRVFSRWEAWEYLIQAAAFAPHEWVLPGGGVVQIHRGETRPLSYDYLAGVWKWSVKKVRVFLQEGIADGTFRAQQPTLQGHTYFLVNYELYQGEGHSQSGDKGIANLYTGAEPGHQREASKERKTKTNSFGAWSRRACDLWVERFGGTAHGGRIGKALKPLVAKHEAAPVLEAWQRYLHGQDAKYASPENFAAKYGEWAKPANGMNGRKQIDDYTYTPTDEFPGWAK